MTISAKVAGARLAVETAAGPLVTLVRSLEHSGQRMPTGVGVMQSGQIGRSQLEQETRVSTSGWR